MIWTPVCGCLGRLRVAAALLVCLSTSVCMAVQATLDAQRIRVESALVTVPVIVGDPQGKFVPGLNADAFTLYNDGLPTSISLFLTAEDPIKIALLLDTSRSTTTVLDKIKKSAARFLLQLRPYDLAMVISFDSEVRALCSLTSDPHELSRAIETAKPGGSGTRMRDAIIEIAQRTFRSISGRKAIVLLTDGEDHGSETSPSDLLDGVAASSTLVYPIFYHVDPRQLMREVVGPSVRLPKPAKNRKDGSRDPWQQREDEAADFLGRISDLSGGRFYRSDVAEFDKAFKQISDDLRSQYLLGFYPDKSKLDGQIHSLEVRVALPEVSVRNRRSYRLIPPER